MHAQSKNHTNPFEWMNGVCYEPPIPPRIQRQRALARSVFAVLAVLIVIGCGLAGLANGLFEGVIP